MQKRLIKYVTLFIYGAAAYMLVELLWRGRTHWTMGVLGGVLFILIGGINNWITWETPIWLQCIIGAATVTVAELIAGTVLNIWLGLGIWDYSRMQGNVCGQICPQYTAAWLILSLVAILADDALRFAIFREDKPRYHLWFQGGNRT